MVSVLVGIVRNLSILSIEAPEWHSMRVKSTKDDKNNANESKRTDYEEGEYGWRILNKCSKKKIINKEKNDVNSHNKHELLSEDDESEEEEAGCDTTREMMRVIEEGDRTNQYLQEKIERLELNDNEWCERVENLEDEKRN